MLTAVGLMEPEEAVGVGDLAVFVLSKGLWTNRCKEGFVWCSARQ